VRALGLAAFVGLAAGADCGDAVAPATGVVTGRVVLHGTQTDELGNPQVELLVMDATGVPIHLRRSDGRTLSATTTDGAFRFDAVAAGTWRVRAIVDPARPIESPPFEVGTGPVEVEEPLRVTSSATLNTYPNPFGLASGVGLEVTSAPGGHVEFEVLTLDLEPMWRGSLDGVPPASYLHVHWGGPDLAGPPGLYWAHLRDTNGDHYDLLFKSE
jgi:hypothetical protein